MLEATKSTRTEQRAFISRRKCLHGPIGSYSTACRRTVAFFRDIIHELLRTLAQRIFTKDNSYAPTNRRRYGTKTLFSERLFFVAMIVLMIAQDRLCTDAAVARAPNFISLSNALEGSRCDVREEIVSVRQEHPSLPLGASYSPSCVKLNRCSGCCEGDAMRCVPTSEYTTQIEISEAIMGPRFSYRILALEFTHHGSCECRSRDETRPVCVQTACASQEVWDAGECRCVVMPNLICVQKNCGRGQQWNEEACRCESSCKIERCPLGQIIDREACRCVPKCRPKRCPAGETWNPVTCSCQHPHRRLIHRRRGGNALRCLCICNFEWRKRALCESRRRISNPEACPCRSRTNLFGWKSRQQ